ncbi:uncharacterized protein METZ01_LOCUS44138 [marine metagenome]|uniref:Uncharacterized protein n=1 Tax=marine metagenome TaxID=408172 RepID=A0A381RJ74_9ZZZZ
MDLEGMIGAHMRPKEEINCTMHYWRPQ